MKLEELHALSLLDSESGLGCEIIRGHLKGSYGWAWLRLADCISLGSSCSNAGLHLEEEEGTRY